MSEDTEPTEVDRNYPYSNYIKSPKQVGATPKGTTTALKKDLDILGYYVDVMTSGTSRAQSVSGPLGNKYFLSTDSDCKDVDGVAHPRHVFVNNIPMGAGPNGSGARGLIPGIVQDMMYINPSKLFSVFSQRDLCRPVTMETRDIYNKVTTETQYVLDDDLIEYPAAWFPNGVHPINPPTVAPPGTVSGTAGVAGTAGATAASSNKKKKNKKKKKENFTTEPDLPETVYYISIGIIGFYLMVKLFEKSSVQRLLKKLKSGFK